jgi:hypothetical protein
MVGKEDRPVIFSHPAAITVSLSGMSYPWNSIVIFHTIPGQNWYMLGSLSADPYAECTPDGKITNPTMSLEVHNDTITLYTCQWWTVLFQKKLPLWEVMYNDLPIHSLPQFYQAHET